MEITVTIPDEQWEEFQEAAQEAVEQSWNGSYEDFAMYIMTVNIKTYIESQQRKKEKKLKRELASLGEKELHEQNVFVAMPDVASPSSEDKAKEKKTPM